MRDDSCDSQDCEETPADSSRPFLVLSLSFPLFTLQRLSLALALLSIDHDYPSRRVHELLSLDASHASPRSLFEPLVPPHVSSSRYCTSRFRLASERRPPSLVHSYRRWQDGSTRMQESVSRTKTLPRAVTRSLSYLRQYLGQFDVSVLV